MGITERVENCICVVVSEETGSISLAEGPNRPLTSSKLKELLDADFPSCGTRSCPQSASLVRQISTKVLALGSRLLGLPSSASREKKMTAKPIVLQDLPLI